MLRALSAFVVFAAVTTAMTTSMTGVAFGILWMLAGFRDSPGLEMAVIYLSPTVAWFLLVSVGIALLSSRRVYFGRDFTKLKTGRPPKPR